MRILSKALVLYSFPLLLRFLPFSDHFISSVKVSCRECDDHVINSDQKMVLFADHPGVEEEDVKYEWQVYIVPDDKSDPTAGTV